MRVFDYYCILLLIRCTCLRWAFSFFQNSVQFSLFQAFLKKFLPPLHPAVPVKEFLSCFVHSQFSTSDLSRSCSLRLEYIILHSHVYGVSTLGLANPDVQSPQLRVIASAELSWHLHGGPVACTTVTWGHEPGLP